MKRYLSVFEMIARSSIYKVLLIIGSMLLAQGICFSLSMINPSGLSIEEYIDQSLYSLIFKIAYVLVTVAIVVPGMNFGSIQSYTLERLRIKEKRIFWLQAIYNILAYVLLWGAQLVMLFASAFVYQKNLPGGAIWTNQTLFLAFYRNSFMHSILPLEDIYGWATLGFLVVVTGIVAAVSTRKQRQGKFIWEILVVVIVSLIAFPRELGYDMALVLVTAGILGAIAIFRWISNAIGGEES